MIYAGCESLIKNKLDVKTIQKKKSTGKVSEHILHGFSISMISAFSDIHKQEVKVAWKKCESLKEHAMKIINFEKKETLNDTIKWYHHRRASVKY